MPPIQVIDKKSVLNKRKTKLNQSQDSSNFMDEFNSHNITNNNQSNSKADTSQINLSNLKSESSQKKTKMKTTKLGSVVPM